MKKVVVFLFVISCCFLSACDFFNNNYFGNKLDDNIDMSPRQISVISGSNTAQMVEQVKSAVVGIKANVGTGYSIGSGVSIRDGGYILTNQHVINGAKNLIVYFADKSTSGAKIIWQDSSQDLAVIKADVNMPYLSCSESFPKVGEDVIAIGTPLALDFRHTVTKGIISALNRTLQVENSNGTISYMQNLIQHDASINPGNSGGPIINTQGEVVGINTLKASDAEGIGFAIPISMGKAVINRLSQNNEWKQSYLGLLTIDPEVAAFEYGNVNFFNGAYVLDIDKNAICYDCLLKGDVILQINDYKINSVLDLRLCLYQLNIGDNIDILLIRNGEKMTIRTHMGQKV